VFRVGSRQAFSTYPGDDAVNSFLFDPTGNGILVGERGGKVWRWIPDRDGGSRVELGREWAGSIDNLAVSTDGMLVAAASGSSIPGIELWRRAASERSPSVIPGLRSAILLRFTNDRRFLVSADTAGELRYWRLGGAGTQHSVKADQYQKLPLPARLFSVVRNPRSNEFIVGGANGVLQIWSSSDLTGSPRVLAPQLTAALLQVPDQQRFVGSDGRNYLLTGHVMQVAVSGDGTRFAAVDAYGFAVVFASTELGTTPRLIDSQSTQHAAFSVALSPNGHRLAVGATSTLTTVHDLAATGSASTSMPLPLPGDNAVRALVFSDDEHLYVGDDAGRVTLWTLGSPPRGKEIVSSSPLVDAIAILRDGTGIVLARGQQVDIVRLQGGGASWTTVTSGLGGVTSLAVSNDGSSLAVGYADGAIRIWSMADLRQDPILILGHGDYVRSLAFDRSGEVLVSVGDDGVIRSSTIGRARLAALVCGVAWRDLVGDEIREFFGALTAHLPTCPPPTDRTNSEIATFWSGPL
jgi:WD40 repeat protein